MGVNLYLKVADEIIYQPFFCSRFPLIVNTNGNVKHEFN